jgi:long-subunit fatty acid transport protein
MKRQSRLALALSVCVLFAAPAFAQSFHWSTASARSQALGGIYATSSDNAVDALAANPAGLTSLSGPTLDVSVSLMLPRGSFSNSVNNSAQLSQTPGALPYGAFGMPIRNSRFTWGVGFAPDLMSVANWHYIDAPGVAGATYGMQQQKSAILAGRAMAGLGVVLNPKISIGVSLGADYNSNTLEAPYIFLQQPVLKGLKTLLDLHTTGYCWNGSVGALIRPNRSVEVGLAWKSRTTIISNGAASGDVFAQFAALGLTGVPSTFNYSAQGAKRASAVHTGERLLARQSTLAACLPDRLGQLAQRLCNSASHAYERHQCCNQWPGEFHNAAGWRSARLERPIFVPRGRRAPANRTHFAPIRLCSRQ